MALAPLIMKPVAAPPPTKSLASVMVLGKSWQMGIIEKHGRLDAKVGSTELEVGLSWVKIKLGLKYR